jgi:hypothetical protein
VILRFAPLKLGFWASDRQTESYGHTQRPIRNSIGQMKGRLGSVIAIPIVLTALVQAFPQSPKKTDPVTSADLGLYETVIRFQISSWELSAHTYCIEINGADADPVLLQRLLPLPVKRASACRKVNDKSPMWSVVDRKTRKTAVIFNLGTIRRVSDSEVQVEGGYWCGNLCMAEGAYRVLLQGQSWHVAGFQPSVMS